MKKLYRIMPDGTLEGLYDDDFSSEIGEAKIKRASEVEFDGDKQGWTVRILLGDHAGKFLPGVYTKRKDALAAEVDFLNGELLEGRLSFDAD